MARRTQRVPTRPPNVLTRFSKPQRWLTHPTVRPAITAACRFRGPCGGRLRPSKQSGPIAASAVRSPHALVSDDGNERAARWMMLRLGLAVFFTMNVMVFTFALWAYDSPAMAGETSRMAAPFADLLRSICFLMSLPVLGLLGIPLAENALAATPGRPTLHRPLARGGCRGRVSLFCRQCLARVRVAVFGGGLHDSCVCHAGTLAGSDRQGAIDGSAQRTGTAPS